MVSKHVLEVRYQPAAKMLDKRGEIAEKIAEGYFKTWSIEDGRVSFSDKANEGIKAYVGYKNFGLESNSPNTEDFFLDKGAKFIQDAWSLLPTRMITRLGVRSRYLVPFEAFPDLLSKLRSEFLSLGNLEDEIGGKVVDIALPINFADAGGNRFDVSFGPMKKTQAEAFFEKQVGLSETGLFVDVDFYKKWDSEEVQMNKLIKLFKQGITKGAQVRDVLLGKIR